MQVAACWRVLLELLLVALRRVEAQCAAENEPVLIFATLQQICEVDAQTASEVKEHLFPREEYDVRRNSLT